MQWCDYQALADDAIVGRELTDEMGLRLLDDPTIDLLPLLNAAYAVRRHFHGKTVQVHILNNAQNGRCPEDCAYCTQAKSSDADIEDYPLKSEAEILAEARRAYEAGAHRYCMVFAGRGPNDKRTDVLADLIRKIKQQYPIEVCVSAGLLDEPKARVLKDAGLDRLNHNLNTSRRNYPNICTTHTFDDRVATLQAAHTAGLECCSGLIVGMGESHEELIELAKTFRRFEAQSIPVNFLLPFEGNVLSRPQGLTPEFCLRVLCLFRLMNPRAEVRCAAGREFHLRSMEVMCLYPANSIFLDGYLNGRGAERRRTYQMLRDAGFEIESEHGGVDDLLEEIDADKPESTRPPVEMTVNGERRPTLKSLDELRPVRA
jgi:biotin synthase